MGSDDAFPRCWDCGALVECVCAQRALDDLYACGIATSPISLALQQLGSQLAVAGALTRAWELGSAAASCGNCDATYHDWKWTPGCGATPDEVDERNKETESGFDCLNCGLLFEHAPGRLYDDSEELECSDCHSKNVVFIDEDDGAYLSHYVCRHGKRDDDACDLCEIEDGCGVGEIEA